MQTKQKANSVITCRKLDTDKIEFTVLGIGQFVFDKTCASPELRARAEDHGWIQRISDKAAIGRTDADGALISKDRAAQMKHDAMKACVEHYMTGTSQWSMVSSGEPLPTNLTIRAISQILQCSIARGHEVVTAQAKKQGKSTQALLKEYRESPGKVRDAYDAILAAERVLTGNSDNLLDELMNGGEAVLLEDVEGPIRVVPKFQKSTKPSPK